MIEPPTHHAGVPPGDVEIDAELVRTLIQAQHPDLNALPVTPLMKGWDNSTFRLGDELVVRLPRRASAVNPTRNEHQWLRQLAPLLPLPVPVPMRFGVPSDAYPWPWAICPWFEGEAADAAPPAHDQAIVFANFLRALHHAAPADAPRNPMRGVPLAQRASVMENTSDRLAARGEQIPTAVRAAWDIGVITQIDLPTLWLHGDLHPRHVLVRDGRFSAVLDWGELCCGDPATDLGALWMLFAGREERETALNVYAPSQATLHRARGWAALFAVVLRDITNSRALSAVGAATMYRIADGPH